MSGQTWAGMEITVQQAADWSGWSEETVRRRAKRDKLGRQPGGRGRLMILAPAWSAYVADDQEALEAIRGGRFDDPAAKAHVAKRHEMGARE